MTNSAPTPPTDPAPRPGKRERLVTAAADLLNRNGVARTSLADVATAADVPLGNVYYYFKTKDDLVQAVIDAHADGIRAMLEGFERHRSPAARLRAFVRAIGESADVAARYGCPHGTLCSELDKRTDGLDRAAATLMTLYVDWAQEQFRLLHRPDARDLAVALVAAVQGGSLLANTFRDPSVLAGEVRRLERWIESLAAPAGNGTRQRGARGSRPAGR